MGLCLLSVGVWSRACRGVGVSKQAGLRHPLNFDMLHLVLRLIADAETHLSRFCPEWRIKSCLPGTHFGFAIRESKYGVRL